VETERSKKFSSADPTWLQLLLVEGSEPRTERLRKAALPIESLADVEEASVEEVVHPRRRHIRQDER
jgi:hypothetical protein